MLTTFDADEHVLQALAAGADGFLLKDTPPPEIVAAIRAVADGEPMLSPSATRAVLGRIRESSAGDRSGVGQTIARPPSRSASATSPSRSGRGHSNAEIAPAAAPVRAHREGARVAALRQAAGHQPGADRDRRPRRGAGLTASDHVDVAGPGELDRAVVRRARLGQRPSASCHGGTWVSSSRRTPTRVAVSPQSEPVRCRFARVVVPGAEGRLGQQQVDVTGDLVEAGAGPGVAGVAERHAVGADAQPVRRDRVGDPDRLDPERAELDGAVVGAGSRTPRACPGRAGRS